MRKVKFFIAFELNESLNFCEKLLHIKNARCSKLQTDEKVPCHTAAMARKVKKTKSRLESEKYDKNEKSGDSVFDGSIFYCYYNEFFLRVCVFCKHSTGKDAHRGGSSVWGAVAHGRSYHRKPYRQWRS